MPEEHEHTAAEQPAPARPRRNKRRIYLLIVVCVLLVGLLGGGLVFWTHRGSQNQGTKLQPLPADLASATNTTLYYPSGVINGFNLVPGSAQLLEASIVSFSLSKSPLGSISVTEQPRPPIMEEVKKTAEFTAPIGPAYIADLDGHTAGFVLAGKTLIIMSVTGQIQNDDLRALMMGLVKQ